MPTVAIQFLKALKQNGLPRKTKSVLLAMTADL